MILSVLSFTRPFKHKDQVGWGRRWEGGSRKGTWVYPWLIHVDVQQKPAQYCRAIILQWKINLIITKTKKTSQNIKTIMTPIFF